MALTASTSLSTAAPDTGRRALRILFADDVRELRHVAQISFTRQGHHVECFADGQQALDRYLADPNFDLVITDHHMPNLNGLGFVTRLRELGFPGRILVFSSELSELVAKSYRELKVDRILYKPVFPSTLRQTLAELFPAQQLAAA